MCLHTIPKHFRACHVAPTNSPETFLLLLTFLQVLLWEGIYSGSIPLMPLLTRADKTRTESR